MRNHLHHIHLLASDLDASIHFFSELLGGEVVLDAELAGARNVFIRVGTGRLHLYDQPPRSAGRGAVHHVGIQTDDLDGVVHRLERAGVALRGVKDLGAWRYVMVPAPDDVLIELFEVQPDAIPAELRSYFD